MTIKIIRDKITLTELKEIANETYGEMIKAVADIKRDVIAIGGELHSDAEAELIKDGSNQKDVWGFNIYVDGPFDEALEYTSLINIRPRDHNPALEIKLPEVRAKVLELTKERVDWSR